MGSDPRGDACASRRGPFRYLRAWGGTDRGRRHRRRREALAHHCKDVLTASELRVVLDALSLRRGRSLPERRDGLLQALNVMHSLTRP